ncbi:MAG: hypothetical protein ACFHWX_15540 [Bacteroidota bacterium]
MRYYILLITVLLIQTGCNDNTITQAEGEGVPASTVLTPIQGFEGLSKAQLFLDGAVVEEGEVLDGLKHGSWVNFDNNGLITSSVTYYKGVKQGASFELDNQGYISVYANYSNDELSGPYKVYNRRRLIEERNYVNGKLEGELRKFYQDGTLMEASNYRDGQLDGIARWYDTEGNLSIAYEYKEGKLVNQEAE